MEIFLLESLRENAMHDDPPPEADPRAQAELFGQFVAKLRQQMQLAGYRRVSQEVLAHLMGTNKSQISRIEHGKVRVTRRTVEKLAEALQLSPAQKQRLFRLAGFHTEVAVAVLPQRADFERASGAVRDRWLAAAPPAAVLIDYSWAIWEANAAFARLFSTKSPAELMNRHMLELAFDPELGLRDALRERVEDHRLDAFLIGQAAGFRAQHLHDQHAPWYRTILQRLSSKTGFDHAWDQAALMRGVASEDQDVLHLRGGGRLIMHSMPLVADRRFLLVRYLPADLVTARLVE
jgi:transcriptional regulator with XRE-family HTH domain